MFPLAYHTLTQVQQSWTSELEHFEMNTNDAYATNAAEIATTENIAYMTAGDTIPATQNVAYKLVPPRSDENYDYIICD